MLFSGLPMHGSTEQHARLGTNGWYLDQALLEYEVYHVLLWYGPIIQGGWEKKFENRLHLSGAGPAGKGYSYGLRAPRNFSKK